MKLAYNKTKLLVQISPDNNNVDKTNDKCIFPKMVTLMETYDRSLKEG